MTLADPAVSDFMTALPEGDFGFVTQRQVYCVGGLPRVEKGPIVSTLGFHTALNADGGAMPGNISYSLQTLYTYVGAITNPSPFAMRVLGKISYMVSTETSGLLTPDGSPSYYEGEMYLAYKRRLIADSVGSLPSVKATSVAQGTYFRFRSYLIDGATSFYGQPNGGSQMLPLPDLEAGNALDVWIHVIGFSNLGPGLTATYRVGSASCFVYGVAGGI